MKKFVALLLAAMMCLGSLCFAEEIDLTGVEAPEVEGIAIEEDAFALVDAAKLAATSDVVDVTDEYTQVTTDGVTITFYPNVAGGGYIVLTQDIIASLAAYMNFKDPYGVLDILVNADVNILIMDAYTNAMHYIYTDEPDALTTIVPNLADLSAEDQEFIAGYMSESAGIVNANGQPWIYGGGTVFLTIANGRYVILEVDEASTEEEMAALLTGLTVTAAE